MTEKEQVIQALRATLISVKGALTLKQCNRDYRELQGEGIPYKALGYSTLDKLFLDVPGFKVTHVNGEFYVDAIPKPESQHVANMVARQKTSKKKPSKMSFNLKYTAEKQNWRKPTSSYNHSNNYNADYYNKPYRSNGSPKHYNNNKINSKYPAKQSDIKPLMPPPKATASILAPQNKSSKISPENASNSSAKMPITRAKSLESKQPNTNEAKTTVPEFKRSTKLTASQRLLNLRESLTMDSIPLSLPAMNTENPVQKLLPPPSPPPPDTASAVTKLEWMCKKIGVPPPEYKHTKSGGRFYCSVKAGKTYSALSYPDASPTEEVATEVAAAKLLGILESTEKPGLPTTDASKTVAYLSQLVAESENGLVSTTIPHLYREKYNENLPSNWQKIVEECPLILQESTGLGMFLLHARKPYDPLFSPSSEVALSDDVADNDLPALKFPEDNFWNVFVMAANSSVEIWLRIIGDNYSNALESLLDDMTNYYEQTGISVDEDLVVKHAWYAVFIEDDGWQRAKVLEIDEEFVNVFLGDRGDEEKVHYSKLRILEPQFKTLPLQAIWCRLEGLEELATSTSGCEAIQQLLTKGPLVAEPGPRLDPDDPAVCVVLYDTSTDRDINLNEEIMLEFCSKAAFGVAQLRRLCDVEVQCVDEECRVFVSRRGGRSMVSGALALLTAPGPFRRPLPAAITPTPDPHRLYIVRTFAGEWVRCIIITGLDGEGTVRTQLVDSGLIMRAPVSSLVPLQSFSKVLNILPRQAIQVRLDGPDKIFKCMAARIRELLLDQCVICRLSSHHSQSSVPLVDLYVRTADNILASVQTSILTEYEYMNAGEKKKEENDTTDPVEALNRKKERIFTRSAHATVPASVNTTGTAGKVTVFIICNNLPPPQLPQLGMCFDVFIPMAANPWNFVIQPNSTRIHLQNMMEALQTECPKIPASKAPVLPTCRELYTVLYDRDNTWYRVVVTDIVSKDLVSVYFFDYGDLALVPTTSLRPPPTGVVAVNTLPPQAIKAKLHDIKPVNQDWRVEDCIRFQELCVEQQFVGVCREVGRDPLNTNEPLLTLDLIDTSTDEDVYINKKFVEEHRGVQYS